MTPAPAVDDPGGKRLGFGDLLAMGAWVGLAAGLVEGALLLGLQRSGRASWGFSMFPVEPDILWLSPAADLLVFAGAAILLAAAARLLPRVAQLQPALLVMMTLALFSWVAVFDRLQAYAAVLVALGVATVIARRLARHDRALVRGMWRTLPYVAALVVLTFGVVVGGRAWRERRAEAALQVTDREAPNVVVIVIDTLRADHLTSYGYTRRTSPTLDRLARDGVLFERAFSASSWTIPSHASMLTGRHPFEHDVDWSGPLDARFPTIAEELQRRGYRTGAFSANLGAFNSYWGFDRGFIRFEAGFHSVTDAMLRTLYGRYFRNQVLRRLGEGGAGRKPASEVNRAALDWIDRHPDRPFFAFLNYFDAHEPYISPPPFAGRFASEQSGRGQERTDLQRPSAQQLKRMPARRLQRMRDDYDAAVAYIDDQVGRLLDALQRRLFGRDLIVMVTSDHGEAFGEHGTIGHRVTLYRELIHVPLIVWAPGRAPSGVRIAEPVSNTALPATLLDLLDGRGHVPFPAPSLVSLWRQSPPPQLPPPLAEISVAPFEGHAGTPIFTGSLRAIVSSKWHYILSSTGDDELYDWELDPAELEDLSDRPDGRAASQRLAECLRTLTTGSLRTCRPDTDALPADKHTAPSSSR